MHSFLMVILFFPSPATFWTFRCLRSSVVLVLLLFHSHGHGHHHLHHHWWRPFHTSSCQIPDKEYPHLFFLTQRFSGEMSIWKTAASQTSSSFQVAVPWRNAKFLLLCVQDTEGSHSQDFLRSPKITCLALQMMQMVDGTEECKQFGKQIVRLGALAYWLAAHPVLKGMFVNRNALSQR